jgi:hypothetical protein
MGGKQTRERERKTSNDEIVMQETPTQDYKTHKKRQKKTTQ